MVVCFEEILLCFLLNYKNGVDLIQLNSIVSFIKNKGIKVVTAKINNINLNNYVIFDGSTYFLKKAFSYEIKRKSIESLVTNEVEELVLEYINELNLTPKTMVKKYDNKIK